MAAAKKDDEKGELRVLVSFAYAARTNGEIVQLVRGDVVGDGFKPESIKHLRSIGFIGDGE